jgi:urease accessory protein
MVVEARGGRTIVGDQFWRVPLQAMPPAYQDGDDQAFVYVLNPTGGVLQGDRLELDVVVRPDARLFLTTQSAAKLYRMEHGEAWETNRLVVCEGALLEYLPDQTIPYAGSSFHRMTRVDVDQTATAIVGEVLSAGRVARGECFQFTRLQTALAIHVGDDLKVLDRLDLRSGTVPLESVGLWEEHHHYAVVYAASPRADASLAERVAAYLEGQEGVIGGASSAGPGVATVRMLGRTMWQLKDVCFGVWDLLRRQLVGKPARMLRKL